METHSSFHLNSNNELNISLQANSPIEYNIGELNDGTKNRVTNIFLTLFSNDIKNFHFSNQVFHLNIEEIASLKDRTISLLPFSESTKSFLQLLFDNLFKQPEIFDTHIAQIIDAVSGLDEVQTRCHLLLNTPNSLTIEDVEFIFDAEMKVLRLIDNNDNNPILKEGLSELFKRLIFPLITKAKNQIKKDVKHLSVTAAAEKGKAMQVGLLAMLDKEKKLADKENISSNTVFSFPSKGVVFKKGDQRSQEEEYLADSLMSLSIERGTVSFFTFSDLSAQRFETLFSTDKVPEQTVPMSIPASSTSHPSTTESSPFTLQNVEAKPYVEGMLTFEDLLNNPKLHQSILQRLNPSSEMKAVLTAELQFLDLHAENLGLIPLICHDHEYFCGMTFSYQLKSKVGFSEFYKDFLAGYIDEKTEVFYISKDKTIKSDTYTPIKEIPNLLEALNSPWEFVLFDTDLNLAESNELQTQSTNGSIQSLIPFRSVLLASDWKNKPLDANTLSMLGNNERINRMRQWVNREDASVRQFLIDPEKIEELIKDKIEQQKYTLSDQREQGNLDITVKDLRNQFAKDMSDLKNNEKFWGIMHDMLKNSNWFKPYTAQEGETLQDIASHNKLTVEELIELNPELQASQIELNNDPKASNVIILRDKLKLRVKADLISESPSAKRQRQTIAAQLFPRLSWRQRNALFERQERCQKYLFYYNMIKNLGPQDPHHLEKLEDLINSEAIPLSTRQKQEFLQQLKKLMDGNSNAKIPMVFIKDLQSALQPTYFNLVKVMYPLLADNYDLNLQLARQNAQTAGLMIGLFSAPLENLFSQLHEGAFGETTKNISIALEDAIQNIKKNESSSYFGEWNTESPKIDPENQA